MEKRIVVKLVGENGVLGIGATPDEVVDIAADLLFHLSEATGYGDLEIMSSVSEAYLEKKEHEAIRELLEEQSCSCEFCRDDVYEDPCGDCHDCDEDDEEYLEKMELFTEFARDLMKKFNDLE